MFKTYVLAFMATFFLCQVAVAQSSKEKEKALKEELKRYKKMEPTQIKMMKDNLDKKTEELRKAEANYAIVSTQLAESQARAASSDSAAQAEHAKTLVLQQRADSLQTENQSLQMRMASMPVAAAGKKGKKGATALYVPPTTGTWFAVQIGAFNNYSVPGKLMGNGVKEDQQDGMHKYTVGQFSNKADAESLKNSLIEMGVKDAFVVGYKNGQRIQ